MIQSSHSEIDILLRKILFFFMNVTIKPKPFKSIWDLNSLAHLSQMSQFCHLRIFQLLVSSTSLFSFPHQLQFIFLNSYVVIFVWRTVFSYNHFVVSNTYLVQTVMHQLLASSLLSGETLCGSWNAQSVLFSLIMLVNC